MHNDKTNKTGFDTSPAATDLAPSKSQRKRDALALQQLGARLLNLSMAQLDKLPLDDDLRAALEAGQAMREHGARRRQLRYLGKLLRQVDNTRLHTALAEQDAASTAAKARHHHLERLCTALLQTDSSRQKTALKDFFDRYPQADRQHLRQLLRNIKHEHEQAPNTPPKSRRLLFRYLREVTDERLISTTSL